MAPVIALVAVAFLCLMVFGAKAAAWIVGIIISVLALIYIFVWRSDPEGMAAAMRKAEADAERARREKRKPDEDWRNRPR